MLHFLHEEDSVSFVRTGDDQTVGMEILAQVTNERAGGLVHPLENMSVKDVLTRSRVADV